MAEKRPEALDLSHHLSDLARARLPSPLKLLQKYFDQPGLISLAGGLPHPAYFPFDSISAAGLATDAFPLPSEPQSSFSWFWKLLGAAPANKTISLTVPKYPAHPGDLSLSTSLQYGMASGLPQLRSIIQEFTGRVYDPAYSNYQTLLHVGNTDGWHKAVSTLCNKGEGIIMDDFTYTSAIAAALPYGFQPISVSADAHGMDPAHLRHLLADWDPNERKMPRPHVMYTVPIGQNPTGQTMGIDRKREIYDVCCEYDVIIVEDDPYFFLQQGPYIPNKVRRASRSEEASEWIATLAPSYLKIDYQGRVIRLDTFSKTMAPGSRMGWFTCNPIFAERLERQGETSTQGPCGFGQSLITSLLMNWGHAGYIRWLQALAVQYRQRRDFFIDTLAEEFDLTRSMATQGTWAGCEIYTASARKRGSTRTSEKSKAFFSFIPPTSGMFVWLQIHLENYRPRKGAEPLNGKELEMKLWTDIAEAGVLIAPGWFFSSNQQTTEGGHFRISFSNAEFDAMKAAMGILGRVMREFFGEPY